MSERPFLDKVNSSFDKGIEPFRQAINLMGYHVNNREKSKTKLPDELSK